MIHPVVVHKKKKRKMRGGDMAKDEKPKHLVQMFRSEWKTDKNFQDWIERDTDETKAKCKFCKVSMVSEVTVLKNHAKEKKHCSFLSCAPSKQKPITFFDETTLSIEKRTNRSVQNAEIKLARYFAEHNIPFLAADHLIDLLKEIFPDSGINCFIIIMTCT